MKYTLHQPLGHLPSHRRRKVRLLRAELLFRSSKLHPWRPRWSGNAAPYRRWDPSEWLGLMADPIRVHGTVDRQSNAAFELPWWVSPIGSGRSQNYNA